ncbi:protein mab-21-like 3 [Sarcophilus harrisii]|uniref:Mab-21 like 3 n=1 Tax=Sarcophilus harrisii TaxID=9305 RepID=A0A7N4PJ18_SARHA|nr:protein mab-21-like 3 [Sarcophilus harrisii]XP_031823222.1 protein mab-21-like 3 [Sarcophilus harrisii]
MEPFSDEAVKQYVSDKVEPRKRLLSKLVEEVQEIVHQLTQEISYRDIRFQAVPRSLYHNENIRILAPTQFVITVPIKGLLGYKKSQTRHWRYYSVSGSKLFSPIRDPEEMYQWLEIDQFLKTLRQWHETDVTMEGDIIPAKVAEVFLKHVEESVKTCNLSNEVKVIEGVGPIVRLAVETSEFQVEVELIPVVEILNRWCEKARWPRCFSRWPSREKVQCVKSFGFNLMARSSYHWQLGFERAEYVLMEGIDEDGGCRKMCYQVLRQMKEDVWCPGNKPVVTAHHLQTILFWTCEKYPRSKDWRVFKKSFMRLVRKLYKCVNQHYLKHFFIKGTNMFQYASINDLDYVAQKLGLYLKNPGLQD